MPFSSKSAARTETANDDAWLTPGRFAVLLAVLTLASYPQVFLGLQTFVYRDFGYFAYPIAYHLRESFWRGEIPLWNPLNNCGIPFLAQWNTQVLYPPALFYVLLPLSWALGVFCLLHVFWGGMGMFVLAQRWTEDRFAAAFAGVVFAFNGLMLNSLMWPATVAALGWMPWVVWLTERAWREGGRTVVVAALAGALQMLSGGTEVVLLTWVLLGVLCAVEFVRGKGGQAEVVGNPPHEAGNMNPDIGCRGEHRTPNESKEPSPHPDPLPSHPMGAEREQQVAPRTWLGRLAAYVRFMVPMRAGLVVLLITGLCAAQLLPFFDFLSHSHRQEGYYAAQWPMPASGWLNFLVPLFHCQSQQGVFLQHNQYWTTSYYVGVATVALALWSICRRRTWRAIVLAGVTVFCLVLSLGETTPLYGWLSHLVRVIGLMRFPIKFVILPVFALPLLAVSGLAVRGATTGSETRRLDRFWLLIASAIIALIFAIIAWNYRFPTPDDNQRVVLLNGLARAMFFAAIVTGLFFVEKFAESKMGRWLQVLLLLLVWLDLFEHAPRPATASRAIYRPNLWRTPAAPQPGLSRAMIPPSARNRLAFSFLPNLAEEYVQQRIALIWNCNLLDDVPKGDGFFPLYLADYAPLFGDDSPAPMLDFVGASEIVVLQTNVFHWETRSTFMPLLTGGQQPIFTNDTAALQTLLADTNFNPREEVFLPAAAETSVIATNATAVQISSIRFSAQEIEADVSAAAPALLVVAQMYYHPWRACVDDRPTQLWRANYGFQALQVPAGAHHVRLTYEDRRFHLGAVLSLATLCGCLGFCCVRRRR
ncbi:MAG: hypothetical protein ABSE16_18455 [Verrucomicrobiota bacterium]|jgi:hypothetical protein